jgi:hypothetical protein
MKRLMWSVAAAALVTGLAACSQRETSSPEGISAERSEPPSPDIAPSAAPGVAFSYGYDFRVDDQRISQLQEAHAAECEKLGTARCRITGLRYTIDANEQVSAMLEVKLEPTIARQFGKGAVVQVEKAGGKLINAEFSGEDEGSVIRTASSQKSDVEARIADIERRLAGLKPGDRERTELQQQLEQLRTEAAEARQRIAASEERLANTPMTFNYYGKGGVPGFRGENPIAEAWKLMIESGVTLISLVLKVVAVALPWAILLLLMVAAFRSRPGRAIRRWLSNKVEEAVPDA